MSIAHLLCCANVLALRRPTTGGGCAVLDRAEAQFHRAQSVQSMTLRGTKIIAFGGIDARPQLLTPSARPSNATSLHSNPHSLSPPHRFQFLPRGLLPRGLSDAYRRLR
jgi:hypothetical protein